MKVQPILAGVLALGATALFAAPAAAQSDKVMLILDSSRSMWGQIDGVNKVVHAREALARFFKQQEGAFQLGLMAYGHQEKASCDDFAVLQEVGEVEAAGYASAVKNISPKGSTPIAAALDAAADEMAKETGRKHIVLLSDGLDNCEGDPCARARQLAQSVPQMTLHAIAFDKTGKEEQLRQLACVAEPSGGIFKFASNRETLDAALADVAARITAPPQTTQSVVPENVDPEAPVPIKLTAFLSGSEERITRGIVWRVFSGRAGDDGRYEMLHEMQDAQPTLELKPGNYFINVSWGLAHATKRLQVTPGQPAHEQLILKAGAVRLNARQASGAPIDMDDARFDIYSDRTDQFGNRERIIANARSGPAIRLNTGTYYVVSHYGDSNAIVESQVEVKPGKLSEVILIHDASKVTFRLAERRGGEAIADTRWTIKTADGQVVERSAGAFPTHILTSGRYRVEAQHGGRLYVREFELAGGGAQQVEVLMR
ncbi:vWA domain-containing protein [Dichotomicrobium thermohalophilum]|uniref:von Willebrand factor type A domain-containing protein n=1 Tax=Dichotomicrobium thermohalophilum TaxID=933063 RepID=A0A397Q243_9HYPH|nr:VWA domain-containing protein [Dichotomicrobium thermohalophilum]RIA55128.1 von Willebrand factor type A domain-containing protein [Dichotomicrobium thermohalophilum]